MLAYSAALRRHIFGALIIVIGILLLIKEAAPYLVAKSSETNKIFPLLSLRSIEAVSLNFDAMGNENTGLVAGFENWLHFTHSLETFSIAFLIPSSRQPDSQLNQIVYLQLGDQTACGISKQLICIFIINWYHSGLGTLLQSGWQRQKIMFGLSKFGRHNFGAFVLLKLISWWVCTACIPNWPKDVRNGLNPRIFRKP